jgi:hypothetical protein
VSGPFDAAQVDAMISRLDRPEDDSRVWQGLRFMERHGIDLSVRYIELHDYVRAAVREVTGTEAATPEEERQALLALRARAREMEGLPPMSPEEAEGWGFAPVYTCQAPDEGGGPFGPETSVEEAIETLRRRSPDLARALVLMGRHNAAAEGDWNREVSARWAMWEVEETIPDVLAGRDILFLSSILRFHENELRVCHSE